MLRNLLTLLSGAILLILGVMASAVVVAVIVLLGLATWGYLWWKTRRLRRTAGKQATGGSIIEGEVVVVDEHHVTAGKILPGPGQQPSNR